MLFSTQQVFVLSRARARALSILVAALAIGPGVARADRATARALVT